MPVLDLAGLRERGWCTDEWGRWQQGGCATYALALIRAHPHLRLGVAGLTENGNGDASGGWRLCHVFAHDDTLAWDSAGRHPLPYLGVHDDMDYAELDADPEDWGFPGEATEAVLAAAILHIERNSIFQVTGR